MRTKKSLELLYLLLPLVTRSELTEVTKAPTGIICGYTGLACSGHFECCSDISADQCCKWGEVIGTGASVKFRAMSEDWRAMMYRDPDCTSRMGPVFVGKAGSEVCVTMPNSTTTPTTLWASARWVINDGSQINVEGQVVWQWDGAEVDYGNNMTKGPPIVIVEPAPFL